MRITCSVGGEAVQFKVAILMARWRVRLVWGLMLLCLSAPPQALQIALANDMPPTVRTLFKKHKIAPSQAALVIYRLSDNKMLAENLTEQLFNPASLAKLPLTFAAFDLLGSDYTWETAAAVDGKIQNGELHGNLYLIGGGDPLLDDARFLSLLSRLRGRGLRKINGALILDDSYFILPPHDAAAFDGKPYRLYNAGGGALAVNFNAQEIVFTPELTSVRIVVEPPNDHIQIDGSVTLSSRGGCRYWRQQLREQYRGDRQRVTVLLRGGYPRHCGNLSFHTAALSVGANTAGVFGGLWRRLGGEWNGQWLAGKVPPNAVTLVVHQSPPLLQATAAMNKFSNNVIARNMLLSLPAKSGEPPYTLEYARGMLHQWMRQQGVDGQFYIDNGSGLSRDARMSASQLFHLLLRLWRHPLRAEMVSSLPLLGVDGTLKKRLPRTAARQGHLKTGSLNLVKNIAGFLRDKRGNDLILISLTRGVSSARAKNFQDALIEWARKQP